MVTERIDTPHKFWDEVEAMVRSLRLPVKKAYTRAYAGYLMSIRGVEEPRTEGLSYMGAQGIRMDVQAIFDLTMPALRERMRAQDAIEFEAWLEQD